MRWWVGLGSDDLFTELWRACAGPLVDVPHRGERVFYFPQGHMEQVCIFSLQLHFLSLWNNPFDFGGFTLFLLSLQLEASLNQELNQQIPQFNLPSKILCRVVHIQLLVIPYYLWNPLQICFRFLHFQKHCFHLNSINRQNQKQMKCMHKLPCTQK